MVRVWGFERNVRLVLRICVLGFGVEGVGFRGWGQGLEVEALAFKV